VRSYMSEKYFHAERFVIPEGCTEGGVRIEKNNSRKRKIELLKKIVLLSMVMIMAWSMVVLPPKVQAVGINSLNIVNYGLNERGNDASLLGDTDEIIDSTSDDVYGGRAPLVDSVPDMVKSDVDKTTWVWGEDERDDERNNEYTVNEDRSQGPPRLASLRVTNGQFFPAFDINFEIYTMDVPPEVTSVEITAIAVNPDDEVYVGTDTIGAGYRGRRTKTEALMCGCNEIPVTVMNKYNEAVVYTLIVNRAESEFDRLKNLKIWVDNEEVELSPAFDPNVRVYSVNLGQGQDLKPVKFTAEPENPSSRVVLGWNPSQTQTDDLTESEGWTSKTKMLNPEEGHTIFFTVKPEESNNVGAYLVMINGTDCNNDLESLKVFTSDRKQEFALSQNFDPDVTEYSIEVPAETKTICLAADASSPMAGVLVNGQQYDYYPVPLDYGTNHIKVTVVAPNLSTKDYVLRIGRKIPDELVQRLDSIRFYYEGQDIDFEPAFSNDCDSYEVNVPYKINGHVTYSIIFEVTKPLSATDMQMRIKDKNSLKVADLTYLDHSTAYAVLDVNRVWVLYLETENGPQRRIEFYIKHEMSKEAMLRDGDGLRLYASDCDPSENLLEGLYQPDTTEYTVSVKNQVDKVTVSAIPNDEGAIISIRGEKGRNREVPLEEGENIIVVFVMAYDSLTYLTYTITVIRRPPDTNPPVLFLPEDMTVEPNLPDGAVISLPIYAYDEEDGYVPVTATADGVPISDINNAFFPIKTTEVKVEAEDSSGNRAEGTFYVTVKHTTPPTIRVYDKRNDLEIGDSIVFATNLSDNVVLDYYIVTSDSHPGCSVTVWASRPSGSEYPIGRTTVTITATDECGNQAVKTFDVIVELSIIQIEVIKEIEPNITAIMVKYGTERGNIPLPEKVTAVYHDGTRKEVGVTWDDGTPLYNKNRPVTYKFTGELNIDPFREANPKNLKYQLYVTVFEPFYALLDPVAAAYILDSPADIKTYISADRVSGVIDVVCGGESLRQNIDYTVTYDDNKRMKVLTIKKDYLSRFLQRDGDFVQFKVTFWGGLSERLMVTAVEGYKPGDDATLQALYIGGKPVSGFIRNKYNYTENVAYGVESTRVAAATWDVNARVVVNGKVLRSHELSEAIPLKVGSNTIEIDVIAQNGTSTNRYTVTVNRAAPPSTNRNDGKDNDKTPDRQPQAVELPPVEIPTVEIPSATLGGLKIIATVDAATGTVKAEFDTETLNNALEGTLTGDDGKKTLGVGLPKSDTESYNVELPAIALSNLQHGINIEITTGAAKITLPDNMIAGTDIENRGNAGVTIKNVDKSTLPEEVRNSVGDKPVIQLVFTVDGEQKAWNNPNAPVTVSIPYTPTEEELNDPEHIVVWYIDGSGKVVPVPNGHYDPVTGTVTFTTTHFSYFAVAYVRKTFGDLGSVEWARKPIEVMASKGIISGTGLDAFSPMNSITRADYLVMLVNTLGLKTEFDDNFDDVSTDAYYYEALGIAKKLGVAVGIGNNRFNPEEAISRQDMMVLTARALEKIGKFESMDVGGLLDKFSDKGDIAEYALDSLAALIKENLIVGSNNKLNPRANATRAEAAVFLYRIYSR